MIPKKGVNYILALVISEVILLSYCEPLSNLRNDDRQIEESYDQDYEFLEVQPKVNFAVEQDESAIVELSSSQCSTRDRTQTCDCGFIDQDLTVPVYAGNMLRLIIRNCKRITVRENSLAAIYNIAHLELENIEDMVLHSNAFAFPISDWGHVNIWMRNVQIDVIPAHTFNGFIRSINIQNSRIGSFERFAINGIRSRMDRIEIIDTTIAEAEPYAFKKFTVDSLTLSNVTCTSVIPSKFFYGIEVTGRLAISNSNINLIHSSAFDMTEVDSFHLNNNTIQTLHGEAFRMALLNGVLIQGNRISECHQSAFRAMRLNDNFWRQHNEAMSIRMVSNALATMETISQLVIADQLQMTISELKYLNNLHCEDVERLQRDQFFNSNGDAIWFRISDKLIDSDDGFHSLNHISNSLCISRSWFWYYVLIGSIFILILLIAVIILLCVWYRRRKEQRRLNVIMPDGRTYRETTIVMQVENHNLLKTDL